MKDLFTQKDEFMHSAIWYICKNGFAKILDFLVFGNTFGFQDEITEAIKRKDESPSLLYIATYYQRESIIQMLMDGPFKCGEEKCEKGLVLRPIHHPINEPSNHKSHFVNL